MKRARLEMLLMRRGRSKKSLRSCRRSRNRSDQDWGSTQHLFPDRTRGAGINVPTDSLVPCLNRRAIITLLAYSRGVTLSRPTAQSSSEKGRQVC